MFQMLQEEKQYALSQNPYKPSNSTSNNLINLRMCLYLQFLVHFHVNCFNFIQLLSEAYQGILFLMNVFLQQLHCKFYLMLHTNLNHQLILYILQIAQTHITYAVNKELGNNSATIRVNNITVEVLDILPSHIANLLCKLDIMNINEDLFSNFKLGHAFGNLCSFSPKNTMLSSTINLFSCFLIHSHIFNIDIKYY